MNANVFAGRGIPFQKGFELSFTVVIHKIETNKKKKIKNYKDLLDKIITKGDKLLNDNRTTSVFDKKNDIVNKIKVIVENNNYFANHTALTPNCKERNVRDQLP